MPKHKNEITKDFLTWLIGFFEGDGYITEWYEKGRYRLRIGIGQKDPALLYKLRSELGFGRITYRASKLIKNNEKNEFWDYHIEDILNLSRFISLLNGNLVLDKRKDQFHKMLINWNRAHPDQSVDFIQNTMTFDLLDGWLSGFSEAEAGFDGNWTRDFRNQTYADGSQRYAIKLKFYLTQKLSSNDQFLYYVANLFDVLKPRIYTLQNVRYNDDSNEHFIFSRLELSTSKSHDKLLQYFTNFPLKGHRRFQYQRFQILRRRQLIRGSCIASEKVAKRTARLLISFVNSRKTREIQKGQWLIEE